MKKIGIVMGSDSDLPVIEKAVEILGDNVYARKKGQEHRGFPGEAGRGEMLRVDYA